VPTATDGDSTVDVLATVGGQRATEQAQRARPDQVLNSAGGYVFGLDDEARLRRFLILSVDSPTYYASARDLALDNVEIVTRMVAGEESGLAAVRIAVEISEAGRAKKNEPALWVIAAASGSPHQAVRQAALEALPRVARTGTHLYTFVGYAEKHRGWGRSLRRAVGRWYLDRSPSSAALQAVKYRQRAGWTHRDALRLSHGHYWAGVEPTTSQRAVFDFACGRPDRDVIRADENLRVIDGYLQALDAGDNLTVKDAVRLVSDYQLPWEALPTHVLDAAQVWEALLPHLGITALIRNLPKMTRVGLLEQRSDATREVKRRLGDADGLKRGRVHPLSMLVALTTYSAGRSARGSGTWTPVQPIVDALDDGFYLAFGAVRPTGKRVMLALDVSASMTWDTVCDTPGITPQIASAAMALVTANVEDDYEIRGFSHELVDVPISPKMRLDQAVSAVARVPMGGTDCALPMLDAIRRNAKVDLFCLYTDNETWAGRMHPSQALREYRDRFAIPARMVTVGMTSTGFSIADPSDPGSLDVVGFDTATPDLISSFARGEF
jgi:60 kDa SS-A/Ro ribonucleoprotein